MQAVVKDNPPLWKRSFYSPILVPVLNYTLATSVWIYYGGKGINYFPDEVIHSRDKVSKRAPLTKEPNPPVRGNRVLEVIESEKPIVLTNPLEEGSR